MNQPLQIHFKMIVFQGTTTEALTFDCIQGRF